MTKSELRDMTFVGHMLESVERIRRFVGRKRRAAFLGSRLLQDAVIRNIEIIGEAAGQVSAGFAARHASIPWRRIVGMRNRLIHGYVNVNLETVWDVVARDLPALEKELRAVLQPQKPAPRKRRTRRRR